MKKNNIIINTILAILIIPVLLLAQRSIDWSKEPNPNQFGTIGNEVVSKRTWNSKTYVNSNDQVTVEISPAHRHYRDEQGKWQEINFRIESNNGYFAINRALYKAKFGQNAKSDDGSVFQVSHTDTTQFHCRITRMGYYEEKSDQFYPVQEAASVSAEVENNCIYYRNIFAGFDLRYTPGLYHLKEEFVISESGRKSLPYPNDLGLKNNKLYLVFEAQFDLNEDLDAFVGKEQISFINSKDQKEYDYTGEETIWFGKKDNRKKFSLTEDWAFYGEEKQKIKDMKEKKDKKVWKRLLSTTKGNFLYFGVPYDWIADAPEGTLCIDPTLAIHPAQGAGSDAFIYDGYPDDNYGGNNSILIGWFTDESEARGLIQFDLTAIPMKADIDLAEMRLFMDQNSGIDSEITIEIHKMLRSWVEGAGIEADNGSESGCDWNYADEGASLPWNSAGMLANSDFANDIIGSISVSNSEPVGWKSVNLLTTVKSWLNGQATNHGLALITSAADQNKDLIASFCSSDFSEDISKCPKLLVSYTIDKLAEFEYDALGRISKISYANGVEEMNRYDDLRGWIKTREYKEESTTWFRFNNALYDSVGNLKLQYYRHLGDTDSTQMEYKYDKLYRLSNFFYEGTLKRKYAYDDNGNRTSVSNDPTFGNETFSYETEAALSTQNRLMKYETSNYLRKFTYDKSGRLENIDFNASEPNDDVDLQYDFFNNMIRYVGYMSIPNYTYFYDANNQRIRKTDLEGTRYYIKSGAQTIAEYAGHSLLEAEYIYAGNRLIAKLPTKKEVNPLPCNIHVISAGMGSGNSAEAYLGTTSVNHFPNTRGHNITVVDEGNGSVLDSLVFDTWARSSAADSMADFISALPVGRIVLVAIRDDGTSQMTEAAYQALESLGSAYCREVAFRGSFAMIGIKGASKGSVQEKYVDAGEGPASVRLVKVNCHVVSAGQDAGNFVQLNVNSVDEAEHNDGYNIVVVDETSGTVLDSDSFDPAHNAPDAGEMAAYINNIAPGQIVLAGIKDDGGWQSMTEAAYLALESIGSALIRSVRTNDSWGIIGIKGAPIGSVTEKHVDDDEASMQTMPGTIFLAPYYVDGYKFYYQDHLGSTRQLSGSDVKIDYYPYGMEMNTAGTETDYKFAGKERDQATGLDYLGKRYLMTRIGRFVVPDRFADMYPTLSPYQYAANNPVMFLDANGDSLILSGDEEYVQQLLAYINKALGGAYNATINKNGLVTVTATGEDVEMTDSQTEFYNTLMGAASLDVGAVRIGIVGNDESFVGDSFVKSQIDIADIAKIDAAGGDWTAAGMIGHVIAEQTDLQLFYTDMYQRFQNGYAFPEDIMNFYNIHVNAGNYCQGQIDGYERTNDIVSGKSTSGIIQYNYTKSNEKKAIRMVIFDGNPFYVNYK